MARWTRAAATDESTPPDSPQTARPLPTWRRTAATASSTKPAIVQVGWQPQMRNRKFDRISPPRGVCTTSGWNCTPQNATLGGLDGRGGQLGLVPTT